MEPEKEGIRGRISKNGRVPGRKTRQKGLA
jgi:hypothetical protein